MQAMPAAGPTLRGIDISHYQGIVDFAAVKASGKSFVLAKCAEHAGRDPLFEHNWTAIKQAGLIRGAYYFFHPSEDAGKQAMFATKHTTISLWPGDLPLILDWEVTDGVPTQYDAYRALQWLDKVETQSGKTPMIYSYPYFLASMGRFLTKEFARFPLCIAHYGVVAPLVPEPWQRWTFWQNRAGSIAARTYDQDVFNGDIAALQRLTEAAP